MLYCPLTCVCVKAAVLQCAVAAAILAADMLYCPLTCVCVKAAVLRYAETNTRVLVFSKLAGMTCNPLEDYYPSCERFSKACQQEVKHVSS
jgi:hypothetical protein